MADSDHISGDDQKTNTPPTQSENQPKLPEIDDPEIVEEIKEALREDPQADT